MSTPTELAAATDAPPATARTAKRGASGAQHGASEHNRRRRGSAARWGWSVLAIAISLVGAIVGELPTGAVAGLGARLLAGSYYGQTVQIWAALFMAAAVAALLVIVVGFAHSLVLKRMGARA